MSENDDNRYIFPFEKLEVWRLAIDFADYIFGLLESFPPNKHLRLVGQMEAAVSSIPQNTAEGKGRQYKKEFIQFLYIAQGSLYEVLTLITGKDPSKKCISMQRGFPHMQQDPSGLP